MVLAVSTHDVYVTSPMPELNILTVLFKQTTWETFREAVKNTQDIDLISQNGRRFSLEWAKPASQNPYDGREQRVSVKMPYLCNPRLTASSKSHVQLSEIVS